jgi:phenylacetate-CoA ligase
MRAQIENRLGIKAYDIYGLSEILGPGVAMECEEKCGLHIHEDHFLPEVIDETGKVLKDGEEGELVLTTLTKEGIPMIRYRTHDIAILDHNKCACGRTLVRVKRVRGRTDDMLIIRGVNVFPSQIETVLLGHELELNPHYLIIVTKEHAFDRLEIQVEVNSDYENKMREKKGNLPFEELCTELKCNLEKGIESMLGIGAKITLVPCGTLPRSEGKAKRVIDKRS